MLRIVNPVHGAMMVTNPAKRVGLRKGYKFRGLLPIARPKRGGRMKGNFFGGKGMIRLHSRFRRGRVRRRRNQIGEIATSPVRKVLPDTKQLTAEAGTLLVGIGAFMANHALGQGVNMLIDKTGMGPKIGGAMGIIKFAARYIGARALAAYAFTQNSGFLSKENGTFVKNVVVISAGVGLLNDLGLRDKLPGTLRDYWPNLAAYESGVTSSQLYGPRHYRSVLSGYSAGVQRSQLSNYRAGIQRSQLSGGVNFDNMPTEQYEVSNYGVPFGA